MGSLCFRDLVYAKLKGPADAVLALVDKERDGEQVDRALIKNALGIFVEMGMGGMEAYETDFEAFLLTDTAKHYARKASLWIEEDSCPAYLIKAEQCLGREKERVGHYLHASSEAKLLKEVEREALATYETRLLEKEHSGRAALLRDDKTEDRARVPPVQARALRLAAGGGHLQEARRARGAGARQARGRDGRQQEEAKSGKKDGGAESAATDGATTSSVPDARKKSAGSNAGDATGSAEQLFVRDVLRASRQVRGVRQDVLRG